MRFDLKIFASLAIAVALSACGGGGGDPGTIGGEGGTNAGTNTGTGSLTQATMTISISSASVSSAAPANVTATLRDKAGAALAGQVVTFTVPETLAKTNAISALTNSNGQAVVVLSPLSTTAAGAGYVIGSASVAGDEISAQIGFQVNATPVTLAFDALTSGFQLSAYGQTTLRLAVNGANIGSPVNISLDSACVTDSKAVLSKNLTFTATTNLVDIQYRDMGCGGTGRVSDQLRASVVGAATSASISIPLTAPNVASIGFVSASPERIYIKSTGFDDHSTVVFKVLDASGNPLQEQEVSMVLLTGSGDVTMEGLAVGNEFKTKSDALGQVYARVNSGTQPTPVRIQATVSLAGGQAVSTVSSNLSVGVGLPSQLNFSLSQGTRNIEGYNREGTPNTYTIIASDRNGNPVPAKTAINFVTEGGQIESSAQTAWVNGISRASVNFVSAEPRPVDGRVTVTAYALGEESFLDSNGNNIWDAGELYQDLGDVFKDRNFNGVYNSAEDEYVPLKISNSDLCTPSTELLALDPSIPSVPGTCSRSWSGAGQVYVRRALVTVFSTSDARPLWSDTDGLCSAESVSLINTDTGSKGTYSRLQSGAVWYTGDFDVKSVSLPLIVADANSSRLNPMAAGTTVSASTPTEKVTVSVAGSPVPSTTEASNASVVVSFADGAPVEAVIIVNFTSPSGLVTGYSITVKRSAKPVTNCPGVI
jgi:hypothetical protein